MTDEEIDELIAENAQLRAALEIYGNRDNWQIIQHPNGPGWPEDWIWYGPNHIATSHAEVALDCCKNVADKKEDIPACPRCS